MKASRSRGPRSDQSESRVDSDPPFIRVTFSGEHSGYHWAMFARVSYEPSDSGYPRVCWRKNSASAPGPSNARIVSGVTPDSERSETKRYQSRYWHLVDYDLS